MILDLGDKKVRLELREISKLKPHEETVHYLYDGLAERIATEGIQRDPIIIDDASGVVLDGMHRLGVLRQIGAKAIVCNVVDYQDRDVKLYRWLRAVRSPGPKTLFRLEHELGLRWVSFDGQENPARLEVWYRDDRFESTREVDLADMCAAMRRFDSTVSEEGGKVEFLDEEGFTAGSSFADMAVLVTPKITKSHVTFAGRSGALLPPKSTLHVFPIRPMAVDYPLDELRSGVDNIETRLGARKWKRIGAPAFYERRRYREELLVFE